MEYTLESLLAEEASLRLGSLSNEAAYKLGSFIARRSRSEGLAISVGIMRGGQRLFWFAGEGTSPDNDSWLERKMRTVLRFGHSSLYFGRRLAATGLSLMDRYGLATSEFSVSGGGFPLYVRGTGVVGAIAVSGLTQEDDHALVVEALSSLKGK